VSLPVFRFAPSPNGDLHLGHAYSAVLNAAMARDCGGRFLVRIEDIDTVRCTASSARRALEDLAWLGLDWDKPVRYQSQHLPSYMLQQARLGRAGLLYPCFCSRKEISDRCQGPRRDPEGQVVYDGHCKNMSTEQRRALQSRGRSFSMRIDMQTACRLAGGVSDAEVWGDIILVRKDIGTSYHMAVVTDDALQGVTDVVRGKDLEAATPIHILLQRLLDLPTPRYFHHKLISDETGKKLSKSAASPSLRLLREQGVSPREVRQTLGFA